MDGCVKQLLCVNVFFSVVHRPRTLQVVGCPASLPAVFALLLSGAPVFLCCARHHFSWCVLFPLSVRRRFSVRLSAQTMVSALSVTLIINWSQVATL